MLMMGVCSKEMESIMKRHNGATALRREIKSAQQTPDPTSIHFSTSVASLAHCHEASSDESGATPCASAKLVDLGQSLYSLGLPHGPTRTPHPGMALPLR